MRRLLMLSMLIMAAASLSAMADWSIGIESSYRYDFVSTESILQGVREDNGSGFDVTIPIEYGFTPWFSLRSGVRFAMNASEYMRRVDDLIIDDYTKMHYLIEFPLMARFSFGSRVFRGFAGVGGFVGIRLFDYSEGSMMQVTPGADDGFQLVDVSAVRKLEEGDCRFAAGLEAEAGAAVSVADFAEIYLACRYRYGLTDYMREQGVHSPLYFDDVSITLGIMVALGGGGE